MQLYRDQEMEQPMTDQNELPPELQPELPSALTQMAEENAQLKDQLLRTMADAENHRKRLEKQLEEAGKFAISRFASDLLDVLDNLYRTTEAVNGENAEITPLLKTLLDGVEMSKQSFLSVCARNGITRLHPTPGTPFDHQQHQAVAHVPNADHPEGSVLQTMQAGYMLHDRLLRPAIVSVTKAIA
jgi:molecular chaperone GrpE